MEYKLSARTRVSKDGSTLLIGIAIERSNDEGETFNHAASFEHRYSKDVTNAAIIDDVKRRVKEFVRADANTIAKATLDERAENLVEALSGMSIVITPEGRVA